LYVNIVGDILLRNIQKSNDKRKVLGHKIQPIGGHI